MADTIPVKATGQLPVKATLARADLCPLHVRLAPVRPRWRQHAYRAYKDEYRYEMCQHGAYSLRRHALGHTPVQSPDWPHQTPRTTTY
jgi:hypothetical protein